MSAAVAVAATTAATTADDDSESDSESVRQCRICLEADGQGSEALISPCACSGSVRYVHRSCLDTWRAMHMRSPKRFRCDLCLSDFRLAGSGASVTDAAFWRAVVSRRALYDALVHLIALSCMAPLAAASRSASKLFSRDNLLTALVPAQLQRLQPWFRRRLGKELSERHLRRLGAVIDGVVKLGNYGCVVLIYSDAFARMFPTRLRNRDGRLYRSPLLSACRVLLEYVVIPICMVPPESEQRLPFFVGTVFLGLVYVWHRLQLSLRTNLSIIFPAVKRWELGELDGG